jgi:hypothetical protein
LTRKKFNFTKKPSLKIQEIENLSICVKYIQNDIGVRLVGIGAEDVHAGSIKLILGMLWSLFRRFKIQNIEQGDKSSEEGLLLWVKQTTAGYDGVHITNYSESFRDGLAFLALVDKYTDGDVSFDEYKDDEPENRLQFAFNAIEQRLGVPQLLDPEEVRTGFVDDRALVLYLSLVFHAFKAKEEADAIERRKAELESAAERQAGLLSRTKEDKDALALERDKLNKESAEITAALALKDKSVEELFESNKSFLEQVEKFRTQVTDHGAQLKKMRKWLEWERDGLNEMRQLAAERKRRQAAFAALETQLKLHVGYLEQMRDRTYAGIPDDFEEDVRPRLMKQFKELGRDNIAGQVGVFSDLLDAEAVRIKTERASVLRIHEKAIKEAKATKKKADKDGAAKDGAKDKKDAAPAKDAKDKDAKDKDAKDKDAKDKKKDVKLASPRSDDDHTERADDTVPATPKAAPAPAPAATEAAKKAKDDDKPKEKSEKSEKKSKK